MQLKSGKRAKIVISARGTITPALSLPLVPAVTVQLVRDDAAVCFESIGAADSVLENTGTKARIKPRLDATTPVPALASVGCGLPLALYSAGTSTPDELTHDALGRTFRVYIPTTYDPETPLPVVVLLHGGFGCGVAGVPFTSVPETMTRWSNRNGCRDDTAVTRIEGDGTCTGQNKCALGNDVELCVIAGGGHVWPGGTPPVLPGIGSCLFGDQSPSFTARSLAVATRTPPERGAGTASIVTVVIVGPFARGMDCVRGFGAVVCSDVGAGGTVLVD